MLVERLNSPAMLATMKEKKPLEEWQKQDALNLRRLFKARTELGPEGKLISQMEFGAKYGIGSQGMVWQYLNAHRPLNIKAAVAFAKGLNIKVSDFSERLAAQIEDASQVEREDAAVQIVDVQDERQLQWITGREAALLSAFRACDHTKQQSILGIAVGFAGGTAGDEAQGEERPARRHPN